MTVMWRPSLAIFYRAALAADNGKLQFLPGRVSA